MYHLEKGKIIDTEIITVCKTGLQYRCGTKIYWPDYNIL